MSPIRPARAFGQKFLPTRRPGLVRADVLRAVALLDCAPPGGDAVRVLRVLLARRIPPTHSPIAVPVRVSLRRGLRDRGRPRNRRRMEAVCVGRGMDVKGCVRAAAIRVVRLVPALCARPPAARLRLPTSLPQGAGRMPGLARRQAASLRTKSARRRMASRPDRCRTGLRPGFPRSLLRRQSRRATDRRS
jgi:hypothetical protein